MHIFKEDYFKNDGIFFIALQVSLKYIIYCKIRYIYDNVYVYNALNVECIVYE